MANSLQDQLMKAGLADKKKANRARQQKREDANRAKRGEVELESPAQRAERLRAEQVERDRQLEAERKARQQEKEIAAQIRQLIEHHKLKRDGGEMAYQFACGKKIDKVYVTPLQHQQLSRGVIALVAQGERYELVPTPVAEKIRQRNADVVLVLNQRESAGAADADDPYADYPIPDDLMW